MFLKRKSFVCIGYVETFRAWDRGPQVFVCVATVRRRLKILDRIENAINDLGVSWRSEEHEHERCDQDAENRSRHVCLITRDKSATGWKYRWLDAAGLGV
ncbi:MAG: hypothetical protein O3A00_06860 [Planctomycetota bacterium]|nr:hypothetical protein [Planctomycetota bacterium]